MTESRTRAMARLEALARNDKLVLSDGGKLIFAPSFPGFSRTPGLWDECHYYNYPLPRLFTLSLLDGHGRALDLTRTEAPDWRPDRLLRTFSSANDSFLIHETLRLEKGESIRVEWCFEGLTHGLDAIVWTSWGTRAERDGLRLQRARFGPSGLEADLDLLFEHPEQPAFPVRLTWQFENVMGTALLESQGVPGIPAWHVTPFRDSFDGQLHGKTSIDELLGEGHAYGAVHVRIDGNQPVIRGRISVSDGRASPVVSAFGTSWTDFFDRTLSFSCSDPHLSRYFDYRLFGLRMNAIPGGAPNIPHPAVCEGPAWFRAPITYSAQCHLLETRWLPTPEVAQGTILNFIHNQQDDGRFIGYLGPASYPGEFFYHADWGLIAALDDVHPDPEFLEMVFEPLVKYVAWFDRERDPENSGLYDIRNHYETGQEYMHRYVVVDEHADRTHWGSVFRLKGVDVSVYLYRIKQGLARCAERLGRREDAARWRKDADRTGTAILERMWDPGAGMFFDINPHTDRRTGVRAAVCFYPYMTDLVTECHVPGLKRNLLDPDRFWTPFPVPSSASDDLLFSAEGLWKGRRVNCPWNGRVWPMTNSHIAEVLGACAVRFDDEDLRRQTTEFISRYIGMMCFDGDPDRPNSFEHYHPMNGRASEFRGIDDYQHSWILDLIVTRVGGIRPFSAGSPDRLMVDPFPFDHTSMRLDHVPWRGHRICVHRRGSAFTVRLDDGPQHAGIMGTPLSIDLP